MPVILIEVVLVFGGALLFGWWQLRSVKRDQAATAAQLERERHAQAGEAGGAPVPLRRPVEDRADKET